MSAADVAERAAEIIAAADLLCFSAREMAEDGMDPEDVMDVLEGAFVARCRVARLIADAERMGVVS